MKLRVFQPSGAVFECTVTRVAGEGEAGAFCLKPRHLDFVAALVPGVLAYDDGADGQTRYVATHEGLLVKRGPEVRVCTRHAVCGTRLDTLRQTVEEAFETVDESEKKARTAVSRLELNLVRRFIEIGRQHAGA